MAEPASMRNIGKEIEKKLKSIGTCSAGELKQIGSKEALFRLKARQPNACLVHLYTLQGAIDDINRLVYRIVNNQIEIAQCRAHYDD